MIPSSLLVRSILELADCAGDVSARAVVELLKSKRLAAVLRSGMWQIMFVACHLADFLGS